MVLETAKIREIMGLKPGEVLIPFEKGVAPGFTEPIVPEKEPEKEEEKIAIEAPIEPTAAELEEVGELKVSEPDTKAPDMTTIEGEISYWKKKYETGIAESEKKQKEIEAKMTEYEKERDVWWKKITERQTVTERREELWEEIDIKPKEYFADIAGYIGEMEGMMNEYNKKEAERDRALIGVEQRMQGVAGSIIRGEQVFVNKQYNIELSQIASKIKVKAAIMEMKQGNFNTARSFIREAIADYTYETGLIYTQYSMFKEENKEVLDELKSEYKEALDKAETASYNTWIEEKQEKTQIMNWALQYAGSGITLEDTLEEAWVKASSVAATQKPPATLTTSQGIMQWSAKKGKWVSTGMMPATGAAALTTAQIRTQVQGDLDNFATILNTVGVEKEEEMLATIPSQYQPYLQKVPLVSALGQVLETKQWKALKVGYDEAQSLYMREAAPIDETWDTLEGQAKAFKADTGGSADEWMEMLPTGIDPVEVQGVIDKLWPITVEDEERELPTHEAMFGTPFVGAPPPPGVVVTGGPKTEVRGWLGL